MHRTAFLAAPIYLGLLLLALGSSAASAQVYYRWIDERGNLAHSDRPPQGFDYEVISARSSLKRIVRAKEGAVPAEITPRAGKRFEAVERNSADQVTKKNPELCARGRSNISSLNSGSDIKLRDNNGELRFLSEEEKSAQLAQAQVMIKAHCP